MLVKVTGPREDGAADRVWIRSDVLTVDMHRVESEDTRDLDNESRKIDFLSVPGDDVVFSGTIVDKDGVRLGVQLGEWYTLTIYTDQGVEIERMTYPATPKKHYHVG